MLVMPFQNINVHLQVFAPVEFQIAISRCQLEDAIQLYMLEIRIHEAAIVLQSPAAGTKLGWTGHT